MTPLDRFLHRGRFTEGPRRVSREVGRQDLARLCADMGFQTGAEIGVWAGVFSSELCQAIPGLRLTCVDPWRAYGDYREKKNDQARLDAAYETTVKTLAPYACSILRMTSTEAATQIPDESLEFVYIDGNHAAEYVTADLQAWTPKVKRGGIVAGHDYFERPSKGWIHVKQAVDDFAASHRIAPIYIVARDKSPSFFWVQA